MSVFYACAAAFGFGIFFNLRGKKLVTASFCGGIGWLFYLIGAFGGDVFQNFLASCAITVFAEIMARAQRAPVIVYLAPALIPLVPGGTIYEAMLYALNGENDLFISTGLRAMTITGALSLGIVAISSMVQLVNLRQTPRRAAQDRKK